MTIPYNGAKRLYLVSLSGYVPVVADSADCALQFCDLEITRLADQSCIVVESAIPITEVDQDMIDQIADEFAMPYGDDEEFVCSYSTAHWIEYSFEMEKRRVLDEEFAKRQLVLDLETD